MIGAAVAVYLWATVWAMFTDTAVRKLAGIPEPPVWKAVALAALWPVSTVVVAGVSLTSLFRNSND